MASKQILANKISVVIITRNRISSLVRTLTELTTQNEKFPIYVVDNHSADKTASVIREQFPEVNLIALKENMGALGRNIGVEHAKTPYIAFCDDDSWWEEGALSKAVRYFETYPDVGAIAGTILVKDQKRLDPTSALQSISPLTPYVEMPGPAILGFLGCGVMVRKEAFEQVGGYNKHIYFSGEEELLGIDLASAGWGITFCADIVGRHYPAPRTNMPQRYRMGARNRILVAWMRRPLKSALAKTAVEFKKVATNVAEVVGFMQGLSLLPRSLKYRQVIPWWVEEQIEMLEAQNTELARQASQKQREFAKSLRLELDAG
jgi:N-acetylglucosaminyl-diphospho-decaprenol L-rhamnosyltransferase